MEVKLDQHFMVDDAVISKIAKAAELKRGERVLEIGAGTGNLTEALAGSGAKVTAVEIDAALVETLKRRFRARSNVDVVHGDAMKLIRDMAFDKLVSNIPYAICEPLLRLLRKVDFKAAVLTVPEGFTDAIMSKSTMLGMETTMFFDVSILFRVPCSAFEPEPDTISAVVKIVPKKCPSRDVLLMPGAKLKNALMEALVRRDCCTKNQAREAIKAMNLSSDVMELPVKSMDLNGLRQLESAVGKAE